MTIEENFRFDTRIQTRMLRKGEISQQEVDQRLAALPDREGDATVVDLAQPASISDEDDE
jgi:hypothetical protein